MILVCGTAAQAADADGENAAQALARTSPPARTTSEPDQAALYCVGYAHLDTQWRWDFVKTIDDYIRATLDDNFQRFEAYPGYVFNFTGSVRYQMMQEYYPQRFARLQQYVADGRWFVSGSSVDEGDVNVPAPESIIRQVLYGNRYFRRTFGKESVDFMLPDCFGFPASMPSLWAHCGLLGFSTQKLTWGSAVGIPFPLGVWEGPDGRGVIAALNPGSYSGGLSGRVDQNADWRARVNQNGRLYGVWADYHYYGVGDVGGAPREEHIRNYLASQAAPDRAMDVVLASSDQLYRDITPAQRAQLPRYRGDMLLTEHSAGTLTSQAYMKRWNRKAEQLADAAERAAAWAWWQCGADYPRAKLERAWVRVLANQMHDILPGTSIPRAYRYSWNDDVIALNQFAQVLTCAVGDLAAQMDTQVTGTPLVVFNPLSIERTDVVEAAVHVGPAAAARAFGPDGHEAPSQILTREGDVLRMLVLATAPANGCAVYDIRPAAEAFDDGTGPTVAARRLENETYRVTFNDAGDIAQIVDRRTGRELLAEPATLVFTHERPRHYPAWNMDWADRQNAPVGRVGGAAQWRVVESGPVRAALAVTRSTRNSTFTQTFRLTRGESGQVVEVAAEIDWQSTGCALKAAFPLTVSNPSATYNWGMGTIERGNNEPVKFEVPAHEWFDLTDAGGEYGVTVLEDCKFGSDKPADNQVRLTLLYTPGVRQSFMDQHSQDWGIHEIRYGLYGHLGDWRTGQSEWRARRFNQPLRAFVVDRHAGPLGRTHAFARINTPQVDVRAIKLAEDRDRLVVRVQELWGREAKGVRLAFPTEIALAEQVDGQERTLETLDATDGGLTFDLEPYGLRAFALELADPASRPAPSSRSTPVVLPWDTDVASLDADRGDGAMDPAGRSYPAEMLPERLTDDGVTFVLGTTQPGEPQALTCRGQAISLGHTPGNKVHILAAATEDVTATFLVGSKPHTLGVQSWTGFIGQWYDRVWDRTFDDVDFKGEGRVVALLPAYVKRDSIAWFATHRHDPVEGNQAYRFSYIYHYVLPRTASATTLTLPYDERIRVFAAAIAEGAAVTPAAGLYDSFPNPRPISIRHDYAAAAPTVSTGHTPRAQVQSARGERFDALSIGAPRADDDVDASGGAHFAFRIYDKNEALRPHSGSGMVDGQLPRLNDGVVARHDDDTRRCVWFDQEGRFTLDLQTPRRIAHVDTYSWHRTNRAPQYFSVWGSAADIMPDAGFRPLEQTDWQLVAVVDTRPLGQGGIHATRITHPQRALGPYRHLLWICEDMGEGTFFTEIDMDFAEPGQ